VNERAVVALRVVFKQQFPIGLNVVFNTMASPQSGQVPLSETTLQWGKNLIEGLRIAAEVDPDEAFPFCQGSGVEGIIFTAKVFHLVHLGSCQQLPVQPIAPGVVGARDPIGKMALGLTAESGSSMATVVEEGMGLPLGIPYQDQAFSEHLHLQKVSGLGQIGTAPHAEPLPIKNPLDLRLKAAGRNIVVARQGAGARLNSSGIESGHGAKQR
jgi:hypothetical protein